MGQKKYLKKRKSDFNLTYIKKSGHQITMDNPEEMTVCLLNE